MCDFCARVGARYADQLSVPYRLIVDVARRACNSSPDRDSGSRVVGGIAISVKSKPQYTDTISARTLSLNPSQLGQPSVSEAIVPPVAVLAFETLDDSWPDRTVFEQLKAINPSAVVLRILHRNGNVQHLDIDEALSHFMVRALAA